MQGHVKFARSPISYSTEIPDISLAPSENHILTRISSQEPSFVPGGRNLGDEVETDLPDVGTRRVGNHRQRVFINYVQCQIVTSRAHYERSSVTGLKLRPGNRS